MISKTLPNPNPTHPKPKPRNPPLDVTRAPASRTALSIHSTGGCWRELRVLGSGLQGCGGRGVDGCPSGDEQGEGGGGAGTVEVVEDVEVEKNAIWR